MEEKLLREKNSNRVKDNNEDGKNGANDEERTENGGKPKENVLETIVKLKYKAIFILIYFFSTF